MAPAAPVRLGSVGGAAPHADLLVELAGLRFREPGHRALADRRSSKCFGGDGRARPQRTTWRHVSGGTNSCITRTISALVEHAAYASSGSRFTSRNRGPQL